MSTKAWIRSMSDLEFAARVVMETAEERVERAYAKLRKYKRQQSHLVHNQRLLKLEYKELKQKYDALRRECGLEGVTLNSANTNAGG